MVGRVITFLGEYSLHACLFGFHMLPLLRPGTIPSRLIDYLPDALVRAQGKYKATCTSVASFIINLAAIVFPPVELQASIVLDVASRFIKIFVLTYQHLIYFLAGGGNTILDVL